jgi:hypothetical protein
MADDAPIALRLAARKTRTLAGEGIVLDLALEVRTELEMETVELNRGRTEVLVSALDGGQYGNRVLTGEDYMVLHRHPPLEPVGTRFVAPAGSAWTVQLELFRYARPLPAGRYRIELIYRWGAGENDVVQTNPVTVEVSPAKLLDVQHRWLGGADARDRMSSLWLADGAGGVRWLYQIAKAHDPSVIETAADLDMGRIAPLSPARPAQLNDIAAMHWERFASWREAAGMGWVKVNPYGRSGPIGVVPIGLAEQPPPRAVEPALQSRADVLHALRLGADPSGQPALAWIEVQRQGTTRQRLLPLPGRMPLAAVAAWNRSEEPVSATLFLVESGDRGMLRLRSTALPAGEQKVLHESKAELVGLEIDQWMGFAWVHLVTRVQEKDPVSGEPVERLEIARWRFDEGAVAEDPGWTVALAPGALAVSELRQMVPLPGGRGLALLFHKPDGWVVVTPDDRVRVSPPSPGAASEQAQLVTSPMGGVFFVFHEPERGFSALPVIEPQR